MIIYLLNSVEMVHCILSRRIVSQGSTADMATEIICFFYFVKYVFFISFEIRGFALSTVLLEDIITLLGIENLFIHVYLMFTTHHSPTDSNPTESAF